MGKLNCDDELTKLNTEVTKTDTSGMTADDKCDIERALVNKKAKDGRNVMRDCPGHMAFTKVRDQSKTYHMIMEGNCTYYKASECAEKIDELKKDANSMRNKTDDEVFTVDQCESLSKKYYY